MDDLLLEHAFLKAPCEELSKSFRVRQKQLHKELSSLSAIAGQLGPAPSSVELAPIAARLASFRAALDSTRRAETAATYRCSSRVGHLEAAPAALAPNSSASTRGSPWEKTRLDRLLVDYMLRRGLSKPAVALATASDVEALCDLRLFASAGEVVAALASHDVTPALRWCFENKRRLNRIGSNLEFRLRLQEVIELARTGQWISAIAYVRTHLVGDAAQLSDVQRVMPLLIYPQNTECEPYKSMYSKKRWEELADAFREHNFKLHGLPMESLFETSVKAGLATLKTRQCGIPETENSNCPTCVEPFNVLALHLPRAQHVQSVLVCSVSKRIMDEDNPPMALPNGNVYGNSALQQIAAANNGVVLDPRTGDSFALDELRKCFIM